MAFLDQREAGSRQRHWIDAVEQSVIREQLGEVRDLGGAADVGQSRQEEGLNDGAQRHVGAETGRTSPGGFEQFSRAGTLFAPFPIKTPRIAPRHLPSAALLR